MVRVTKETRPWGDGGKQMTRKVYAANSSRFYDACFIMAYTYCLKIKSNPRGWMPQN